MFLRWRFSVVSPYGQYRRRGRRSFGRARVYAGRKARKYSEGPAFTQATRRGSWIGGAGEGRSEGPAFTRAARRGSIRRGPHLRGPQGAEVLGRARVYAGCDAEEGSVARKKADRSLRAARFTPAFPPQRAS
jgi:hypothetical protein